MEKINKEYPILSNWKFVFKEMYDLDHKYPWYIAVRSVAGFLAPFIAAIIPSAAISMIVYTIIPNRLNANGVNISIMRLQPFHSSE